MSEPVDWSSTADEWANTSSSSTGVPTPVPWISSVPNGLVAYGSVCFIGVVVFTALLVAYYARPKLPPVVGALTFLAWSDRQAADRRGIEGRRDDSAGRDGGGGAKRTGLREACGVIRWSTAPLMLQSLCDPLNPSICLFLISVCARLCTFVICFLVPIDLIPGAGDTLDTVWSVLFWCSFMLMWFIIPLASGYYDNGEFTFKAKMKSSLRMNGILFLVAGIIGVIGVIYLKAVAAMSWDDLSGLAIAASNTWGLAILVLMAGYGLVEFPRSLWHTSDLARTKEEVCYHARSADAAAAAAAVPNRARS
jgi:hypothetical protein